MIYNVAVLNGTNKDKLMTMYTFQTCRNILAAPTIYACSEALIIQNRYPQDSCHPRKKADSVRRIHFPVDQHVITLNIVCSKQASLEQNSGQFKSAYYILNFSSSYTLPFRLFCKALPCLVRSCQC